MMNTKANGDDMVSKEITAKIEYDSVNIEKTKHGLIVRFMLDDSIQFKTEHDLDIGSTLHISGVNRKIEFVAR